MDHMEYSITLPAHVELTNAGAEWAAMKQRHFNHVNPNPTLSHQPSPANLFTSFLISISFDQVQDVLNMLGLSVEEALRFNKILKCFEDLCLPRFLIIYNRYRFFMCKQNGPEFNGFLQQLLAWSDLCEFGELKDILLKDSIIRGISEESVRQHLLGTEQLDFNKTVEICKAGLVKHYATDRAKTSENGHIDAWTDTCNDDIVDNNNSGFTTVDKAIGNSVELSDKETQTDFYLNDVSVLADFEGKQVGCVGEIEPKESSDYPIISDVDGITTTSLFVSDSVLHDSISIMADEALTGDNSGVVTDTVISLPSDLTGDNQTIDSVCMLKEGKDKTENASLSVRRSLRNKKKLDTRVNVAIHSDNSNSHGIIDASKRVKDVCDNVGAPSDMLSESCNNAKVVSEQTVGSECSILCQQNDQRKDFKSHMNTSSENQFVCRKCGNKFADAYRLKKHMQTHGSKEPFKCPECQKCFKWSASLQRHMTCHNGARPYKCKNESCDSSFADLTSLRRHTNSHTKKRPYKCNSCNSTFPDSWALRVHERIHSGERPYHCGVCDATFSRAHHLKDHEKLHSGEKPYECEFCPAKFIEASKLKSHRRKHTGEKPYSCKVCGKSFTWSAAYNRHVKTHTMEKPYTCQVCGNAFADNTTLIRHQRTHTGEKPYCCDQCPAAFADSSGLSRHRQIHSTEKDFTCSLCDATFAVKAYLTRHLRTHSGAKPHQCNVCCARFGDTSKLNRHKKIHTRMKRQDKVQHQQRVGEQNQIVHEEQHHQQQQLLYQQQQQEQQQQQQLFNSQHQEGQQEQQFHQHQQQPELTSSDADSQKTPFLLWQDPPEAIAPSTISASTILDVTVSHTAEEPILLSLNTPSDFTSAPHQHHSHHSHQQHHVQDIHDMSQYLSSPLLEFDHHLPSHHETHDIHSAGAHQPHNLHDPHDFQTPSLHEPHHLQPTLLHEPHDNLQPSPHPSGPQDVLNGVSDQGFITDIPVHIVDSTVLEDILNIKS